uniref:Uncharacterized protein n=1 Tax=Globisporangium ultimum (strain ATCC 200006 / CBS 805.95 / DAOM BR144) TaxID=431595 RepID=K3X3P5_GLOUD
MPGITTHGLAVDELFASDVRCAYPSKVCTNYRAIKLNGTLHKLCEFHRRKANLNQKRLQQRRRLIRQQKKTSAIFNGNATFPIDSTLSLDSVNMAPYGSIDQSVLESILFGEPSCGNAANSFASIQAHGFAMLEPAEIEIRL